MGLSVASAGAIFPLSAIGSFGASLLLVQRLERLAGRFALSETTLGLLVALAADSPEISTAVTAAIEGKQRVGAGVVLGSNALILGALLGVGPIAARWIRLHRRSALVEGAAASAVAVITLAILTTGADARIGLALTLIVLGLYVSAATASTTALLRFGLPRRAVAWRATAIAEAALELSPAIDTIEGHSRARTRLDALIVTGALGAVVVASALMERSAVVLGTQFRLSSLVIGALLLAAVTSLPNVVGGVYLAARGNGTALLSEATNSAMLNVVFGLFAPGAFTGLGPAGNTTILAAWYCGLTVIALVAAFAERGLSRRNGFAIVLGYLALVVVAATR